MLPPFRRVPWTALSTSGLLALLLASCGEAPGLPDRRGAEVLETYGEGDDADLMVLDQLAKAGSDLSQATNVRWYVYFPSDEAAKAFAGLVREKGWAVERRATENAFLCLCARSTVPTLEAIRAMREELAELAKGLEPDIDGWEAAVQK